MEGMLGKFPENLGKPMEKLENCPERDGRLMGTLGNSPERVGRQMEKLENFPESQ